MLLLYSGGQKKALQEETQEEHEEEQEEQGEGSLWKDGQKTDKNFDKKVSINILISYIIYISVKGRGQGGNESLSIKTNCIAMWGRIARGVGVVEGRPVWGGIAGRGVSTDVCVEAWPDWKAPCAHLVDQ